MKTEKHSFLEHISRSKEKVDSWPEWKKETLSLSKKFSNASSSERRREREESSTIRNG